MVAAEVDPERLVFVDEMGMHTSLAPLYGYSRKGERVQLQVPRNRGRNTTLLASITLGGMGETLAVEGSTNREVFEAYVEHVLAPTLEAGQLVIMDNLSAHKPARVRELIESRGCELIYLPAYSSPDFNPIEEAFAKIKGMLRQAGARTKEALVDALGEALSAVSAQDARGYFQHAGYRPQVQLL
jgi:transposase